MAKIMIVWGLWGPYHCSRFEALRDLAAREGHEATGVSLFSGSSAYQWTIENLPKGVVHFDLGKDETKFPLRKIGKLLAIPLKLRTDVALLPSYDHWSLALNTATRLSGGRVVMMNDTHAGTARARGFKAAIKKQVVTAFHAGFVAGKPQRRYFASLGLPSEKIFTGYDVVDNDYFVRESERIRNLKDEIRAKYCLPERYFLSLGRFVAKKNLATLVTAYRQFLDRQPASQTHLVLVGSGENEAALRSLCHDLRLPVYDKTLAGNGGQKAEIEMRPPGVHFYGFRQVSENPVFYALADAFVLASLYEEWGLVVNEAMACGLPVVVSETAGCAEDLLAPGRLAVPPEISTNFRLPLAQLAGRIRQNGFLFNPKSAQSLANALMILEASSRIRENMGKASRQIIERFSCQNFAANALLAAQAALDAPLSTNTL